MKRKAVNEIGPKTKRNTISIGMKLDIVNRFESGEKIADLGRRFSLNPSTISTIIKEKNNFKVQFLNSSNKKKSENKFRANRQFKT